MPTHTLAQVEEAERIVAAKERQRLANLAAGIREKKKKEVGVGLTGLPLRTPLVFTLSGQSGPWHNTL